jgi:microcystin degradation protein MlrC
MRLAKSHEGRDGIVSTSVILVHPYLDFAGMGSGGLVIADGDYAKAEKLARQLAAEYWQRRFELEPTMYAPADAVQAALAVEGGPVVIVEAADCCGGGAVGDSVAALKALLAADLDGPALVPLVDAQAAAACHQAGVGAEVELALGHGHDPRWGEPIAVRGRVLRLSDGRFLYSGGIWEGIEGEMGPTAVLELGQIQVLVATYPTYEWDDEQFSALEMDAAKARIIVAKNPMNYRMAYDDITKAVFVLDTPGPTPATVRNLPFTNRARPFFPLDYDMALDQVEILRSVAR